MHKYHTTSEAATVRRDREWKLFLDLCAPLSHEISDLPEPTEWARMLGRLEQTRFEALAYHNLRARGLDDAVPAQVMAQLRAANAQALARYHLLGEMVSPHLEALASEVDFLVLKGTAWAHTVYPEPYLRQSGDIDLLVKEEDEAAAGRVLGARGFEVQWGRWQDHGPTCSRPGPIDGSVCIELHPDLSQPTRYPRLRGTSPADRASEFELWGLTLRACAVEIGYLQVLFQLAWRLRTGGYARYLVDLAHLPTVPGFGAASVGAMVRDSGLRGLRHCGLVLLTRETPPPLPHILAGIGTWAFARGLSCPWARSRGPRRGVGALASLALWDHWDDRGRHVWGHLRALPRLAWHRLGGPRSA